MQDQQPTVQAASLLTLSMEAPAMLLVRTVLTAATTLAKIVHRTAHFALMPIPALFARVAST